LDLKNKVESHAFGEKSHGSTLHEQAKEIEMLRHELSEQEKMLVTLKISGMYAFVYVCSRAKSMDCISLQYDILSVKMLMHVSLDI
jgi:hypothetical protein